MSTINVRDGVMQILNKAHSDAKREIYKNLSIVMAENEQLRTDNNDLKDKVAKLEEKLQAHIDIRNMETAIRIENKEPVAPKKELKFALTDEDLFREGDLDDCTKDLYFNETSNRLYKYIGLDKKEGTGKPGHRPVLLIAKDASGSMGVWEKYMAECISTWTEEMLTRKYGQAAIVRYVNFNTSAKEVEREEFIKGADGGGTIVSSAVELLNLLADEYDYTGKDDIHVLFLSDGDNLTTDNKRAMRYFRRLVGKSENVWYLEPNQYDRSSTIRGAFEYERRTNGNIGMFATSFTSPEDVIKLIDLMFNRKGKN